MAQVFDIAIGYTDYSVPYYTNYIVNDVAKYLSRAPNKQEAEIILYGINIADYLSKIPSVEIIALKKNQNNRIDDRHIYPSSFRKDNTILQEDISYLYLASSLLLHLKDGWNYNYSNVPTQVNNNTRRICSNSIEHYNFPSILRYGLVKAGYFKKFNATELIKEVQFRRTSYPNQPIYVYMDAINNGYMNEHYHPQLTNWEQDRVYLVTRSSSTLPLYNSDTNAANLILDIPSHQDDMAYSSIGNSLSAVVAAGQIRVNSTFQDFKQVSDCTHYNGATGISDIHYQLRQWLGIRIAPYEAVEDPKDSYSMVMESGQRGRLNLIEED